MRDLRRVALTKEIPFTLNYYVSFLLIKIKYFIATVKARN